MSANKNIAYNHVPAYGAAGSATGTVTGPAIDTTNYTEATIILAIGTIAGSGTLDVKVQDSPDGSTDWQDVLDPDSVSIKFPQKLAANNNTAAIGMLKLDGNTVRKWFRIVSVVAVAAADHGVSVLLTNSQYKPDQTPTFVV